MAGSSSATSSRLACTNGTCWRARTSSVGQFVGGQLAALVERGAAVLGQALDAGLDGDAAGAAEQLDHVGLPEVDPRLDAELDAGASTSASSSGRLGRKISSMK